MDDYRRKKRFRQQRLNRQGFYERRQQRSRARRAALRDGLGSLPTLRQIADHENLITAFYDLKRDAGRSPGPDGIAYDQLGRREVSAVMRGLSKEIIDGTYEPSKARQVKIRKSSGKGFRTLSLRSILHRVVAKVLADALGPYFDQMFLPGSHGFRPGRGPWSMLVEMERIILEQGRYVIAQDDIANAFDNVEIGPVVGLYRRYIDDLALLDLTDKVLRGHQTEGRTIGIDQGSALSPLSLNVGLHHALDRKFGENAAHPPWLRYADNLVYLCRGVDEGQAAIQAAQELLQPIGMTLKGVDGHPVDIRHQKAEILGFAIRWENGQIRYDLAKGTWKDLEIRLSETHGSANPHQMAIQVIRGWLQAHGPAFESNTELSVINRILRIAAKAGYRELSHDQLKRLIQSSRDRWGAYRRAYRVRESNRGGVDVFTLREEERTQSDMQVCYRHKVRKGDSGKDPTRGRREDDAATPLARMLPGSIVCPRSGSLEASSPAVPAPM